MTAGTDEALAVARQERSVEGALREAGLHRGDLGRQRARIAPLLTGEDLAELLALADFCLCSGGSMVFGKRTDLAKRLAGLRLIETFRPIDPPHVRSVRLTKLGWLTLLTRAENEMEYLLPAAPSDGGGA